MARGAVSIFRIFGAFAVMAGFAAGFAAPRAEAASATITSVVGTWIDPAPDIEGVVIANRLASSSISWGQRNPRHAPGGVFGGRSGYVFEGASGTEADIGEAFALGAFTHQNWPIRPASVESVGLEIAVQGYLTSGNAAPAPFTLTSRYLFRHHETPNPRSGSCVFGGVLGVGINAEGCADKVEIAEATVSGTIRQEGVDYFFELLGFNGASSFLTREKAANSVDLMARISAVPGPAPLALLLGAFGVAAFALRRRGA